MMRKRHSSTDIDSTEAFFEQALALARRAEREDEVPVGAVIVCNSEVVGRGFNRREQDQDPLAHAELIAIREAARHLKSWRLEGCSIYVTLEPCPMCLAALQQARIERVIYGARDLKGGALSLGYELNKDTRTHHRFEVEEIEFPPGALILKEFFARKRKRKRGSSTPS